MKKINSFLFVLAAILAFACGGQAVDQTAPAKPAPEPYDDPALWPSPIPGAPNYVDPATYHGPEYVTRGVWVQPHPEVDADELIRGYNWWRPVGFEAFLTDREHADIIVTVNDKACEPNGWGEYVMGRGWAEHGKGFIELFPACFPRDEDGNLEPLLMAQLGAHEGGHTIGMYHIPFQCDGSDKKNPIITHPNGTPMCGVRGVMSPAVHYKMDDIQPIDILNFDVRAPGGMFPTGIESEGTDLPSDECVYLARVS